VPSNNNGPRDPGDGDLPPELDPRHRRSAGPSANSGLPPELDPRGRRHARRHAADGQATPAGLTRSQRLAADRPRSDVLRGAALGVRVTAALISLLVLLGSGWAWATYRNFTADIKRVNAITGGSAAAKNNIDGQDQNILIVGNDDRQSATDAELKQLGTTRDGGSLNTDTMMLLHVPANGTKATIISFPRDSYVDIPGFGKDKLNSAYVHGTNAANGDRNAGAQVLVKTIENLTGLSVDHFVQVDLLGFYRISNAIGGVDVCLNAAQKEPNSGINLPAGHSIIKGTQALAFVRQRYNLPNGDLDRIKRQQYFLSAVFRKMSSAHTLLNPFKLQNLLKAVTSSLQMDGNTPGHTGLDPIKLAQQMQNLQAGNVTFTTIPTNGFQNTDVGNVVVVDTTAMPDFIDGLIGTDAATALKRATAASPDSVTIQVVNDTSSNGLETTNASALRAAGFKTVIPAPTSDVLAKTTIRYAPGQESAAKALQAEVPGAVMVRSSQVSGVTLLLGNNKVQVKSLMPSKAPVVTTPKSTPNQSASSTTGAAVTTAADAGCIN
jgi:LCP family protein required for cell wall assembly